MSNRDGPRPQVRPQQRLEQFPKIRHSQVQQLMDDDLLAEVGGLGQEAGVEGDPRDRKRDGGQEAGRDRKRGTGRGTGPLLAIWASRKVA